MIYSLVFASTLSLVAFLVDDKSPRQSTEQSKHLGDGRKHVPKYGFSFKPPVGWNEQKSDDGKVMLEYMGSVNGEFTTNVNIRRIAYNGQALNIIGDSMEAAQKKLRKFQLIERNEVTIDGSKALQFIVQFSMKIGDRELEVRSMQYYVKGNGKKHAFVITFTTQPGEFEGLRKVFEDCAKSIKTD